MENPDILQQEISALEAKLAAKRAEMGEAGQETLPEKEHLKEVLREHAQGGGNEQIGVSVGTTSSAPTPTDPARQLTDDEQRQVLSLVQLSFSKGIQAAIKEAQRTGDAFFVDQLHDRLADEYYEKLLQARKIAE